MKIKGAEFKCPSISDNLSSAHAQNTCFPLILSLASFFAQMGNQQTSASGVRSRTTASGGAAQQQQTQQAEHEYDPYVQGGVSDALCRIWVHAGESDGAAVRHPSRYGSCRTICLMQVWGSPRCLNEYTVFLLFYGSPNIAFLIFLHVGDFHAGIYLSLPRCETIEKSA